MKFPFFLSFTKCWYRWLDYRMQRVKTKAENSKDIREGIELFEEKVL